jgi:hypothetical protein
VVKFGHKIPLDFYKAISKDSICISEFVN